MGMKQFHKEQEAILQQQVVQDDAVVKEDEEEIAEVKQRLKQVIHHKLAPVQASILEEADVELGTASVPVAPDPGSEEVTDEDVEEEDPEQVIELLAREVATLQKQQSHLVA